MASPYGGHYVGKLGGQARLDYGGDNYAAGSCGEGNIGSLFDSVFKCLYQGFKAHPVGRYQVDGQNGQGADHGGTPHRLA